MSADRLTLAASGLEFTAIESGEANNSVVLCLHGFPDSPHTFRHQIDPLAAAGYRVIVPTLRGYEPSSQPDDGDLSLVALADDVVGWLDDLGIDRAHLVGHDWGAVITYVAAARHPDRILTATAMAVPPLARIPAAVRRVPRQLLRSWYISFFQLRGLSERALRVQDWWLLRRLWQNWSPAHSMTDSEWRQLRSQFEEPGVLTATLAYYRQNATAPILLGIRSTPAMKLTEIAVPMLIINGTDDGCMDRRLFDAAIRPEDHPAGVRHVEIDDAGHFVHLERPELINELLLEHLRS
ncbi:MAG: pimeloyl-ACP methyl ester carboxylesterase [Paracrocinitomix sp.]|jgi:pimeloyl-ACP methyl ester carboxylesterase